ncbi:hypothetical protein GCM10010392_62400 [Streptomyces clavifer]|nr:hypothetical protein GCM10010392_62400 [Streptomyces clavifer]
MGWKSARDGLRQLSEPDLSRGWREAEKPRARRSAVVRGCRCGTAAGDDIIAAAHKADGHEWPVHRVGKVFAERVPTAVSGTHPAVSGSAG